MNRYQNIEIIRKIEDKGILGKRYFKGTKYPEIPLSENDVYIITSQGDRYDLLAQKFYKDVGLWWVIPIANTTLTFDSIFIPEGSQIRIPTNIDLILSEYYNLNRL